MPERNEKVMTAQELADAYNASVEVHTYPEMNARIKEILRLGCEPMHLYAAARIEELEKRCAELEEENTELLDTQRETCEACGLNYDCQYDVCAGFKWRNRWREAADQKPKGPFTRFAKIRACSTPEAMAFLLNCNERRFCPKAYTGKTNKCSSPCGECICDWLKEEEP